MTRTVHPRVRHPVTEEEDRRFRSHARVTIGGYWRYETVGSNTQGRVGGPVEYLRNELHRRLRRDGFVVRRI